MAEETVKHLFNKVFSFNGENDYVLPPEESICEERLWETDTLMSLKKELNATKSTLNDKGIEWHKHTAFVNKAGLVRQSIKSLLNPEMLTQAWCKFYEIVSSFSQILNRREGRIRSFHMCEAPGAFISALNWYLCSSHPDVNWEWFANTLNPYYEGHSVKSTVVDDRLLLKTLRNWHFGPDNTGDVMSDEYFRSISELFAETGNPNLITADGSICCLDNPGEQELVVANLQFSEVLIALKILAEGGSLVLKKFTLFECISVCTMYLLNCVFHQVHVFKPVTSKPGNSEVYVICCNYKGLESAYIEALRKCKNVTEISLFPRKHIPLSFMIQLENCCRLFFQYQVLSIKENLELFSSLSNEKRQFINQVKECCAEMYIQYYGLNVVEHTNIKSLYGKKRKTVKTAYGYNCQDLKSLFYESIGPKFDHHSLIKTMTRLEKLNDVEDRLNKCFPMNKKRSLQEEPSWLPVWMDLKRIMKRNSYSNWMLQGKPFAGIRNSKFCNPLLLLLWTEMLQESEVSSEGHLPGTKANWDLEELSSLVTQSTEFFCCDKILNITRNGCDDKVIANLLKLILKKDIEVHSCDVNDIEDLLVDKTDEVKKNVVIVIDCTSWDSSFNSEIGICQIFIKFISSALKILSVGDCIMLNFPSLFCRYTAGLLFMLLSLFTEVSTVLPFPSASTLSGQVWLLSDYGSPTWSDNLMSYLDFISNVKCDNEKTIMEVVPVTLLCGGHFYDYLLDLNTHFMERRIRQFLNVEKNKCQ